ncbi:MAG: hypothetical protein M3Q97_11265 [Bacteroidota bacterium]|nr:hypothetical protein [Bacteroidota bacterium]
MTKRHQNFTWILAVMVLMLLSGFLGSQLSGERNTNANNVSAANDQVTYTSTENGDWTAERRSYEVTIAEYKKSVLNSRNQIKALRARIGKLENLKNDLEVQLSFQDQIIVPVHDTLINLQHDTVLAGVISYSDRWMKLKGIIANDSLTMEYEVKADLNIVTYQKRDGFMKPEYLAVNILSSNPHLDVEHMENYQISTKKRFYQTRAASIGIGLLAGGLLFR